MVHVNLPLCTMASGSVVERSILDRFEPAEVAWPSGIIRGRLERFERGGERLAEGLAPAQIEASSLRREHVPALFVAAPRDLLLSVDGERRDHVAIELRRPTPPLGVGEGERSGRRLLGRAGGWQRQITEQQRR